MGVGKKVSQKPGQMPAPELLKSLETLARELDVSLKYEDGEFHGGLCRIRGRSMIILPRHASAEEKIERLANGLSHFDMDRVYVLPLVRDLLDSVREKGN